jgi:YegS/Rv2252/BmrU family lipid kinase
MLLVILNPIAGNGRALALEPAIKRELEVRGIPFNIVKAQQPEHASQLTRNAQGEGYKGIVCAGGDGTFFEVVNGLTGTDLAVYIVPCGTGNDFTHSFSLSRDPIQAFIQQLDGEETRVDMGVVNQSAFANVSGAGFDVEVLKQTKLYKGSRTGLIPYVVGVIAAIRHFKPLEAELFINGELIGDRFTMVTVANCSYFGGGMKVAPGADPMDTLFDVITIKPVKRWHIPFLLPLFINGSYIKLPITTVTRADKITLRANGLIINIDGELREVDRAEYSIIPGGLKLSLPRSR